MEKDLPEFHDSIGDQERARSAISEFAELEEEIMAKVDDTLTGRPDDTVSRAVVGIGFSINRQSPGNYSIYFNQDPLASVAPTYTLEPNNDIDTKPGTFIEGFSYRLFTGGSADIDSIQARAAYLRSLPATEALAAKKFEFSTIYYFNKNGQHRKKVQMPEAVASAAGLTDRIISRGINLVRVNSPMHPEDFERVSSGLHLIIEKVDTIPPGRSPLLEPV